MCIRDRLDNVKQSMIARGVIIRFNRNRSIKYSKMKDSSRSTRYGPENIARRNFSLCEGLENAYDRPYAHSTQNDLHGRHRLSSYNTTSKHLVYSTTNPHQKRFSTHKARDPIRPNTVSFSFAKSSVGRSFNAGEYTPAPGYYSLHRYWGKRIEGPIFRKPVSRSVRVESCVKVPLGEVKLRVAGYWRRAGSNFQKFSLLERDKKDETERRASRSKEASARYDVIEKNIRDAWRSGRKEKEIQRNSKQHKSLLRSTRRKKKSILQHNCVEIELMQQSIKLQMQAKEEHRMLLAKERPHIPNIIRSWLFLRTFTALTNRISKLNSRYKISKKHLKKHIALFFIFSLFFGKLLRRWRMKRSERLIKLLTKTIKNRKGLWKFGRQVKAKRKIAEFLHSCGNRVNLSFLFSSIAHKIKLIQRWYKWHYMKEKMLYGLMLRQWSVIEYVLLNIKGKLSLKQLNIAITKNILNRNFSKVIPKRVRIRSIKEYLNVILCLKK
eukprot:TRINITY_DN5031_c0_g2_i2.p1 TRINITY_DN5031_c0_g2~~TRINITY_DN5031_c0_g2_i2.p1  ORF type:complete len:495 (+),score=57.26 TRINITY_DN5031_c0_g2_i2:77-1561(+)